MSNTFFHHCIHSIIPHSIPSHHYSTLMTQFCVLITLLEAMNSGKPVLASRVGGIPEVITDNDNGLLFPPADSSSISKAIKNMYQDLNLTKKMSAKSKNVVKEKFSSTIMAEQYLTIYLNLVK